MPTIRVKKIPGLTAPYWDLSEYFLSLDGDQTLTPEQVAAIIAALGLGTMATQDEGTGAGDFRDNAANDARFMQPGDFGIGAVGDNTPTLTDFHDISVPNGIYKWVGASTANAPTTNGGGGAVLLPRSDGRNSWIASRPAGNIGQNEPAFFIKSTSGVVEDWGPWREIWHAGNLRSNAENDAAFVALTGNQNVGGLKTFTSGLSIAMAEPQWAMTDTSDGNKAVAIALSGNQFLIAADRNGDGTVEAPIALLLNSDANTAQLYGSLAFTRANILGTVSQSGGTPTGAVIQRGSNSDGEFVRFADGTQICTHTVSVDLTTTGAELFPYSAAFIATPGASLSWSATGVDNSARLGAILETRAGDWVVRKTVAGSGPRFAVSVAIGRWF